MSDNTLESKIKVKSLYKSLQLLSLFDQEHPERGITELAELSGMLKSSAYNIVSTFEAYNVLRRNPKTGKYMLGTRVLSFANAYSATNSIDTILKPYMDELSEEFGEVMYLAIPDQEKVVYIYSAVPKSQLAGYRNIRGVSADMHCTGIGKAMLAYLPESSLDAITSRPLAAYTQNTIVTREALAQNLATIRSCGYAVDDMEHEFGVKCVAVPLFNIQNELVGAISVSGPSPRFTAEKIEEFSIKLLALSKQARSQII